MTDDGIEMLKLFEQFRSRTYLDSAGKPTIAWGHLIKPGESFQEPISPEGGESLLLADIDIHERAMLSFVKAPLKEHEQDALASLVFNIGGAAWRKSTILRYVNSGHETGEIANEFTRWVKSGGVVQRGLVRRRNAEAARYLGAWPKLVEAIYLGAW